MLTYSSWSCKTSAFFLWQSLSPSSLFCGFHLNCWQFNMCSVCYVFAPQGYVSLALFFLGSGLQSHRIKIIYRLIAMQSTSSVFCVFPRINHFYNFWTWSSCSFKTSKSFKLNFNVNLFHEERKSWLKQHPLTLLLCSAAHFCPCTYPLPCVHTENDNLILETSLFKKKVFPSGSWVAAGRERDA